MAHICDYCGGRMLGGGQGFRDTCENGCDDNPSEYYSREFLEREDAIYHANLEAIQKLQGEQDDS